MTRPHSRRKTTLSTPARCRTGGRVPAGQGADIHFRLTRWVGEASPPAPTSLKSASLLLVSISSNGITSPYLSFRRIPLSVSHMKHQSFAIELRADERHPFDAYDQPNRPMISEVSTPLSRSPSALTVSVTVALRAIFLYHVPTTRSFGAASIEAASPATHNILRQVITPPFVVSTYHLLLSEGCGSQQAAEPHGLYRRGRYNHHRAPFFHRLVQHVHRPQVQSDRVVLVKQRSVRKFG